MLKRIAASGSYDAAQYSKDLVKAINAMPAPRQNRTVVVEVAGSAKPKVSGVEYMDLAELNEDPGKFGKITKAVITKKPSQDHHADAQE